MDFLNSIGMAVGLTFGSSRKNHEAPLIVKPVQPEWALSMMQQTYPLNCNVTIIAIENVATDEARNKIVKHAQEIKARYLWFVDADTAPPAYAARKLVVDLESCPDEKVMVAAGIYCVKNDPTEPIVYKKNGAGAFWKWKVGELFECEGIGTGCMMINMKVFEHLEEPYFKTVDRESDNPEIAKFQGTDDIYFCQKVVDAGFKIIADGAVLPIHWGDDHRAYELPKDSYPFQGVNVNEDKREVLITK
jgi:hypothetical protein